VTHVGIHVMLRDMLYRRRWRPAFGNPLGATSAMTVERSLGSSFPHRQFAQVARNSLAPALEAARFHGGPDRFKRGRGLVVADSGTFGGRVQNRRSNAGQPQQTLLDREVIEAVELSEDAYVCCFHRGTCREGLVAWLEKTLER
jgi:hypothetical protein